MSRIGAGPIRWQRYPRRGSAFFGEPTSGALGSSPPRSRASLSRAPPALDQKLPRAVRHAELDGATSFDDGDARAFRNINALSIHAGGDVGGREGVGGHPES